MTRWSRRDRDALVRIVERVGKPWHLSEAVNGDISVFLVRGGISKHVMFQSPCLSNPEGRAFKTIICGTSTIEWIDGGLREYVDFLEIGIDELLVVI